MSLFFSLKKTFLHNHGTKKCPLPMDEIQNELRYRRGGSSMSVILHSTENASMVVFKPIFAILIYYIIFLH